MDYYRSYYGRYINADPEMREATKAHWLHCLRKAINEENETLLEHSCKVLAMYTLAEHEVISVASV